MKRICFVVASDMTVRAFLLEQLRDMSADFDITVVANTGDLRLLERNGIPGRIVPVRIVRRISFLRDVVALFALFRLMRAERFDIVHSVTPKAGLLAMLAGVIAGIPVRVHMYTGQVWVTRHGLSRMILKGVDRLIGMSATDILVDSPSQRDFLLAERVVSARKSAVLEKGSICGVDTKRFSPNCDARREVREQLGISPADVVFLYLGRLNRDKGVLDLAPAFRRMVDAGQSGHLVFVGPDEEELEHKIRARCHGADHLLHFIDYTEYPERVIAASDILCLPSYREGFGSVIIEAAACGVPSIASRIYGLVDAVVEGETGILHETGNVEQIRTAMAMLGRDSALRSRLGGAARRRAIQEFSSRRITRALMNFYSEVACRSATFAPDRTAVSS